MKRRTFVQSGLLSLSSLAFGQTTDTGKNRHLVKAGTDRFDEQHSLGFSKITFKVASADTEGGAFIMEHDNLGKGGPYRHVHSAQDEWLFSMAGEFRVEIGEDVVTLKPGDSVLMPRNIPHVWAQVSDSPGKLLIAFTPAGNMEAFFRDFGKTGKLPTDATVLGNYGIKRLGPPLTL